MSKKMYIHFQNKVMISTLKIHKLWSRERFTLTIYLLINILFILRYSERQEKVLVEVLTIIYVLMVIFGLYFLNRVKEWINQFKKFNLFFLLTSIIIFISFIIINMMIDEQSLNIDRWSALEVLISNILEGNYPYDVKDHLGQTTSNLPGLFYLGLPFYLLKDIGFLQCVVFLMCMSWLLYARYSNFKKTLLFFLLLMSPAYLWEVFVKSDLMSNIILSIIFIDIWNKKNSINAFNKPILLSLLCAFFILTRGVVLIPLIIFLFKDFIKINLKSKITFLSSLFIFLVLLSLPVIVTIPNYETLMEHNPFNHQVKYAPTFLIIIALIVPFYLSFKSKNISDVFYYSFIVISSLMVITFLKNIYEEGFRENIHGNIFDLSYLGMIIPFILMYFINKENTMHA